MDELLTMLQLGCGVQLDRRQAVRLGTHIQELSQQNASLFSQLEAVKRVANDKQLEVDHCRATCDELRVLLTKANNECDRLRSLAVAVADLSIDVAQNGIDASKRIEELEREVPEHFAAGFICGATREPPYKDAAAEAADYAQQYVSCLNAALAR